MAVCEATFGARLIGLDMARLSILAITAVAVIAIPEAQAVDTSGNAAETEEVTVTGELHLVNSFCAMLHCVGLDICL